MLFNNLTELILIEHQSQDLFYNTHFISEHDVFLFYFMFEPVYTYVWVIVFRGDLVQVQQGLVDTLLQLQGTLQCLHTATPLIPLWFLQQAINTQSLTQAARPVIQNSTDIA